MRRLPRALRCRPALLAPRHDHQCWPSVAPPTYTGGHRPDVHRSEAGDDANECRNMQNYVFMPVSWCACSAWVVRTPFLPFLLVQQVCILQFSWKLSIMHICPIAYERSRSFF
jgi:hypothetical protein